MANDDDYEDREVPMWLDPVTMLQILVANSPEINVRVALENLIDYLARDRGEEERSVSADDLMEVIAQSLAFLHHHVGEEKNESDDSLTYSAEEIEKMVQGFRDQIGNPSDHDHRDE
jgi:hypothetical protein